VNVAAVPASGKDHKSEGHGREEHGERDEQREKDDN
jgi:hypothetical protein